MVIVVPLGSRRSMSDAVPAFLLAIASAVRPLKA
jgi:hypothetical protein